MTSKKDTKHCEWLNVVQKQHKCCLTFKQKLRTLKAFQNLLIIAGHKETPSAHNHKRFDSRSSWKGEEQKNLSCISVLLLHLLFTLSQRCVSDHLVQPVKSLYLCKYLFCINAASTFEKFCYLYCLSFNDRALTVPNIGPLRLQNTEVAGKGYQRGQETRYNPKPNKCRICSHESQEKFNSVSIPICLKCLQTYTYRKWCWWKYCH